MNGLIQYSDIADTPVSMVAEIISGNSKLLYGTLTLDQLQIGSTLSNLQLSEKWEHEIFGFGAYVFFDSNDPVYVGQADSNFKHRFQSHRHFDGREKYGFNELARFVAQLKFGNRKLALEKETFFSVIIPEMEKFKIVRINLMGSIHHQKKCTRLESLINMSINRAFPGKLYNGLKSVGNYNPELPLKDLM